MNDLVYNLTVFKNLEYLTISDASISKIEKLGSIRKTVRNLIARNNYIKKLCDLLLCDSLHREIVVVDDETIWTNLQYLDLSFNDIELIDKSVILMPKLVELNLSNNKLSSIGSFLTKLTNLKCLNLANNFIQRPDCDLHTKLGNIKKIDLSQNHLTNLEGFSKLYSVVYFNLSSNDILEVDQVQPISNLPCLEELILTGNPVATIIDYRTKILELFGKRACEICLDNEKPTQKELDKVAVIQALKAAKEGRVPDLNVTQPFPPESTNVILERPDIATIARE